MPQIEINGHRIHYEEHGTGPPVVLVHGSLSDLRVWRRQIEAFSARYRTIAFSFRFYHPNARAPEDAELPLSVLVDDLRAFLSALELPRPHLVGQSMGAFVCLLLALRDRATVRSLVIAEPPLLPLLGVSVPPRPHELLRLLIRRPRTAAEVIRFGARGIGPARRAFARGDDEGGLQAFLEAALGRETLRRWPEERLRQVRENVSAFKAVQRAGLPSFSETDARSIEEPTLLVTGESSAPVMHRITDRIEELMPHTERVSIPAASHLMYEDNPDAFNEAVLAFLDRLSRGARALRGS